MIATARTRRASRRGGITIVETIVLMTVVATMLGLCVLMLQMLMKLEAAGRGRREASAAVGRLAEQFRDDLHAARSASMVEPRKDSAAGLRAERPGDRVVEYRIDGSGVLRLEAEKGKPVRRERYDLPRCGPIDMAVDREGEVRFARLTLDRRSGTGPEEPARPFEIIARVGRNRDHTPDGAKP